MATAQASATTPISATSATANSNSNSNNFNFNNNHNHFAVGNGNRWHDHWHHGYWGGGNWGGVASWGLGFGAGYRHGWWNGYASRPWYRPWYSNSAVWGHGAWALGPIYYDSGYTTYSNPYYVSSSDYYDYSQPIQVVMASPLDDASAPAPGAVTIAAPAPPPEVQASLTHLDAAQEAFAAGDYVKAGAELDVAIKDQPSDAALHEFRALVYFATGDYAKAAGALYAVLAVGPGWDWTTMSSLYPSVDAYSAQLRTLESFVKKNSKDAAAHFVLAYHYITATHNEAAIAQLQQVEKLMPSDRLASELIVGLGGESASKSVAPPAAGIASPVGDPASETPPPDIDAAKIVGKRTAKRDDGSTFTLDLTRDNKFTWTFTQGGKKQSFGGTYQVNGAVLVLERDDKASMPGLVTMDGAGFNFKIFGTPSTIRGWISNRRADG